MHPNIAQLSRWWVAKCIITDIFDPAPFNSSSTPPTNDPPTSLLQEAAPYDLYPEEGDQLSQHTGTISFFLIQLKTLTVKYPDLTPKPILRPIARPLLRGNRLPPSKIITSIQLMSL
jgi:hypothetical protein